MEDLKLFAKSTSNYRDDQLVDEIRMQLGLN